MEEQEDEAVPEEADRACHTESVYRRLEVLTGEDHDTVWARNFEQTEEYHSAANTFGRELRDASADSPGDSGGG